MLEKIKKIHDQGDEEGLLTLDAMAKVCKQNGTLFKHPTYYRFEVVKALLKAQQAISVKAERERVLGFMHKKYLPSESSSFCGSEVWVLLKTDYQSLKAMEA